MLVDSHCHLNLLDLALYPGGMEAVIAQAHAQQVTHMLCVGTTLATSAVALSIAQQYTDISASVGVHPNECEQQALDGEVIAQLAQHDQVVAVGETGLDYYRTPSAAAMAAQQTAFRLHIRAARQVGKPLIVHTRNAVDDTLRILREERAAEVGGVLHCFTETEAMARAAIALNFYISFSGIITFKNAREIQAIAQALPLERLLIETDAPYLAPVPHRGQPNQPAYVYYVAEYLAQLKAIHIEQIAQQTTRNFFALFATALRV